MTRRTRPTTPRRVAQMHSRALRMALASSVMLAAGCAHSPCPPFRAAWYLDKPEASVPTIYLALLNEGMQPMPLQRIVLNPTDAGAHGQVLYPNATAPPESLQPGRLLLVNLDGKLDECHLPVAVRLQCGERLTEPQPVSGRLPNYLHQRWIDECTRPRPPHRAAATPAGQR